MFGPENQPRALALSHGADLGAIGYAESMSARAAEVIAVAAGW